MPSGGNSVVECLLAKEDVASSSLVSRFFKKNWSLEGSFLMLKFISLIMHLKYIKNNL